MSRGYGFNERLNYSNDKDICEDLNNFYKENFYIYGLEIESIETSPLYLQKHGIDKIIKLKDGTCFSVEEKIRENDYGDILLETWSVVEKGEKGWPYKILSDYLLYYKSKNRKLYLIQTTLLKIVWSRNHKKWEKKYPKKSTFTKDRNYKTEFICVPEDVFFNEITDANYVNGDMTGIRKLIVMEKIQPSNNNG